jgi:hypothetical protein
MGRDSTFGDEQFYGITGDSWFENNLVFIVMSFSPRLDDVYNAVKGQCDFLGLRAVRVDNTTGSGIVLKKIYDLIESAEFLIVDLTDERPNVYYELGYAHGVGNSENDILLVAKNGTRLHFDIAPLKVHFYSSTVHLCQIVKEQLSQMIDATRR